MTPWKQDEHWMYIKYVCPSCVTSIDVSCPEGTSLEGLYNKKDRLQSLLPILTLIWVGFLGVRFEEGGGEIKLIPCLKLVWITLGAWNFVRKYTQIFCLRKYTSEYQGSLKFTGVSIFLQKIIENHKNA